MKPYKVKYVPSCYLAKHNKWKSIGRLDGYESSKDVEALLLEEDKNGYELVSIVPMYGQTYLNVHTPNTTTGFMVTFKLKG